jgi:hypothetical protein
MKHFPGFHKQNNVLFLLGKSIRIFRVKKTINMIYLFFNKIFVDSTNFQRRNPFDLFIS